MVSPTGTLNVALLNAPVPNAGTAFTILSYGSLAADATDFDTVNGLNLGGGIVLQRPNLQNRQRGGKGEEKGSGVV